MADYPLTALLSGIDYTIPADQEANNKWPAVDRQIRYFLAQFLAAAHDDSGNIGAKKVKSGCIDYTGTGTIADPYNGAINGARDIALGSITADRLVAGALTASQLGTDSVGTTQIADGAVTHDQLGLQAVEAANIKNGTITTTQLAANAVYGTNIKDGEVTAAKLAPGCLTGTQIGAGQVTADKLAQGTSSAASPLFPVCAGADAGIYAISGAISATVDKTTNPYTIKTVFIGSAGAASTYCKVIRSSATAAITAGWNLIPWTGIESGASLLDPTVALPNVTPDGGSVVVGGGIKILSAGVYYIRITVSGYSLGKFVVGLATAVHGVGGSAHAPTIALAGNVACAPYGVGTVGIVDGLFTATAGQTIMVELYSELDSTNGLGIASGSGSDVFATFEMLKF